MGGGPRGAAAAEGDAGVTRSGISRGVSCGRGGRVGELGGVVLFVVLGFGVAVAVGPKVRGKVYEGDCVWVAWVWVPVVVVVVLEVGGMMMTSLRREDWLVTDEAPP